MTTRRWLFSALFGLLFVPLVHAQSGRVRPAFYQPPPNNNPVRVDPVDPATRPSRRPVNNGIDALKDPEDYLAQRLRGSRDQKDSLDKQFMNEEMKKLAKKMLQDPKFLQSMRQKLTKEDLEKIAKLRNAYGEDFGKMTQDPAFKEIIKKNLGGKTLTEKESRIFKDWIKTQPQGGENIPPIPPGTNPGTTPGTNPDNQQQPGNSSPENLSGWERIEARSADWFKGRVDGMVDRLDRWFDTPSGKSWRDSLANFAERGFSPENFANMRDRFSGGSKYIPKIGNYFPKTSSVFRQAPSPNLPRFGGGIPSAPSFGGGINVSAKEAGWILLILVAGGFGIFLLSRIALMVRERSTHASVWQLGPWPVQPGQIRTRGELVRAFEYLSLLLLGPAARTHHHLDLGHELAQQRRDTPGQQAADRLTQAYEQARYTPAEEPIPENLLAAARRDLCLLAGVSGA